MRLDNVLTLCGTPLFWFVPPSHIDFLKMRTHVYSSLVLLPGTTTFTSDIRLKDNILHKLIYSV